MKHLIETLIKNDEHPTQKDAMKHFFETHPDVDSQIFDTVLFKGLSKNRFVKINDRHDFRKYNFFNPTKIQRAFANDRALFLGSSVLNEDTKQKLLDETTRLEAEIEKNKELIL